MAAGAWLNMSFPKAMKRLSPFAPLLAASMTVLISASIVAQNAAAVRAAGPRLALAVVCLHLGAPGCLHLHMSDVSQKCWDRDWGSQPGLALPGPSVLGQDDSQGNAEASWSAVLCAPPMMCHQHHLMRRRIHTGIHSVTPGRARRAASQDKLHRGAPSPRCALRRLACPGETGNASTPSTLSHCHMLADTASTCVQVGMQNSALGAVLATLHFADPLTAIPCAISATTHSLLGSVFAGFWRMRDPGETGEESIMGVQEEERVVTVQTGGNSISDLQIRKAEAKAWIARWREGQH